ncbi:unnamed protein product, partial [Laminaria digitata]
WSEHACSCRVVEERPTIILLYASAPGLYDSVRSFAIRSKATIESPDCVTRDGERDCTNTACWRQASMFNTYFSTITMIYTRVARIVCSLWLDTVVAGMESCSGFLPTRSRCVPRKVH